MTRDEVYLEMACTIAKRSKDPSTKIGAVLTEPGGPLISCGYNGPPASFDDSKVDWSRPAKYAYVLHAEVNAILYARRGLKGCWLYVSGRICSRCVLMAAAVGVARVVCGSTVPRVCDDEDWRAAQKLAAMGGIELCFKT